MAKIAIAQPVTRPSADPPSIPETTGTRLVRRGFVPGARIGDWVLERRLGRGGMAEVWRATSIADGGSVALKRMLPTLEASPGCRALFLEEARIGMRLDHPNLVRCLDIRDHEGEPFMVVELVEGPSCSELLSVAAARRERIPLGAALYIALETLAGLACLHSCKDEMGRRLSVVHRDVSPGNVLLGRGGVVRLADFGIVQLGRPRSAKPAVLQGKRGYLAPEQIAGDVVDLRADLFALAVLAVELATGRLPYDADSELELLLQGYHAQITGRDALPPSVAGVLWRALSQRQSDRFGSAGGMARALLAAARADGIEVGPELLAACLERNGFMRESEASDLPLRRCGVAVSPVSELAATPSSAQKPVSAGGVLAAERAKLLACGRAVADGLGATCFGAHPKPAWRVPLDRGLASEVLVCLARARATGLLVARADGREKRVYLHEGLPTFVASTDENELLGARLLAAGFVTRTQVIEAIVRAEATGVPMGTALVDLGHLRPIVLLRALVAQLVDRYGELASWRHGELLYCPEVQRPKPVLHLHQCPETLVARALQRARRGHEVSGVFLREPDKLPNSPEKFG